MLRILIAIVSGPAALILGPDGRLYAYVTRQQWARFGSLTSLWAYWYPNDILDFRESL